MRNLPPIKCKEGWLLSFRLDSRHPISLVITSGKGELYGHVSIFFSETEHGDPSWECWDYTESKRCTELGYDDYGQDHYEVFYLSYGVQPLQAWLNERIA